MTTGREGQDVRWARLRRVKNWATLVAFVIVGIAIAVGIVGLPVIRSAGYHELVAAYLAAQPREEIPSASEAAPATWNFDVALDGGSVVRVEAQKFMDPKAPC